jgi:enoyl-CoA hydratase
MSSSSQNVLFQVDQAIATITLHRPDKLNTITGEMTKALAAIVDRVNDDDSIRVVILNGTGERAFSAGSDIKLLDEYGANWQIRNRLEYCRVMLRLRKPLIGSIRGFAIGGGLEMALVCDIRIASETARFGAGEIKLGWHGGGGVTQLLPRVVGPGYAALMLLTGDMIDAQEALRVKLVEKVVPDADLETLTLDLAKRIANNAPIAAQISKHLVRMAMSTSLDVGLAYETDTFAYLFTTRDHQEGINAFIEKRAPNFEGK